MKLDNFLQLFVVKEKRFFPLFIESAENIVKAADLLVEQTKISGKSSGKKHWIGDLMT